MCSSDRCARYVESTISRWDVNSSLSFEFRNDVAFLMFIRIIFMTQIWENMYERACHAICNQMVCVNFPWPNRIRYMHAKNEKRKKVQWVLGFQIEHLLQKIENVSKCCESSFLFCIFHLKTKNVNLETLLVVFNVVRNDVIFFLKICLGSRLLHDGRTRHILTRTVNSHLHAGNCFRLGNINKRLSESPKTIVRGLLIRIRIRFESMLGDHHVR